MRTFIRITVIVSLVLAFTSGNLIAGNVDSKLKSQVEAVKAEYYAAKEAFDFDKMLSYCTDDIVFMPHSNPMMNKDEMIASLSEGKAMGIKVISYTTNVTDLWGSGNMVYEVGTYEVKAGMEGMPGDPMEDKGSYITVWEKDAAGALKRKYDIWNTSVNSMAEAPPAETKP